MKLVNAWDLTPGALCVIGAQLTVQQGSFMDARKHLLNVTPSQSTPGACSVVVFLGKGDGADAYYFYSPTLGAGYRLYSPPMSESWSCLGRDDIYVAEE
jgi:hypothetical protein